MQPNELAEKTQHEMEYDQAVTIRRDCVCSDCYGQLVVHYDGKQRKHTITCGTTGCPCHGFVSRRWVERRIAENRAEAAEAKHVLEQAVPWMARPKKSADQILSELGF